MYDQRISEGATHVSPWGRFQDFWGTEMRCRYWFRPTPFKTFQQHIEWQGRDGVEIITADTDAGWVANWTRLPRNATPAAEERAS